MRVYSLSASGLTIAGANTLVFINPGTTCGIEIRRMWAGQTQNATSAQQRIQAVTQVTAFPTLAAATPRARRRSDPASIITGATTGAAGTCGVNATAEGGGAKTVIFEEGFNVVNGWVWQPLDRDEYLTVPPGGLSGFGLYLPVAPANVANWFFGIDYAELA